MAKSVSLDRSGRIDHGALGASDPSATYVIVGALVAVASALFFIFYTYPNYLHSDAAWVVLSAASAIRDGQWIPADWYYVSDSLPMFDTTQIAIPFVHAFGVSPFAMSCTASVCLLAFIAATYYLGLVVGLTRSMAFAASALMLSGASLIYSDLLLGLMVTAPFAATALLLTLAIHALRHPASRWAAWAAAALVLEMAAANPRKALAFQALPMLVALAACCSVQTGNPRQVVRAHFTNHAPLLKAIAYGWLSGTVVHKFLLPRFFVDDSYARQSLALDLRSVVANMQTFASLAAKFLGVTEDGDIRHPMYLAVASFRLVSTAVFLSLFALSTRRAFRARDVSLQFLAIYATASGTVIAGALITGAKIKEYYGIYYLAVALIAATIVICAFIARLPRGPRHAVTLLIVLPTLLLSIRNHVFGNADYIGPGVNQRTTNVDKQRLIDWLQHKDLRYGYTGYWDANAISVLSNGKIHAVPATVWATHLEPFRWITSKYEIDQVAASAPAFVAIVLPNHPTRMLEGCSDEATVQDVPPYRVYIFRNGIQRCLEDRPTPMAAY